MSQHRGKAGRLCLLAHAALLAFTAESAETAEKSRYCKKKNEEAKRSTLMIDAKSRDINELKAVERLEKIHEAQLLSYLKLSGCKVGLIINFNVRVLKNGLRRIVMDLDE
ncbi:MAG: GxxExxY protein [Desulfatiglandales bacterium]